jgi:hypothetical protein
MDPVVLGVGSDLNPKDDIPATTLQSAVMIANPNGEAIFTALQAPETKGRMAGIALPQPIVLGRKILNIGWQSV